MRQAKLWNISMRMKEWNIPILWNVGLKFLIILSGKKWYREEIITTFHKIPCRYGIIVYQIKNLLCSNSKSFKTHNMLISYLWSTMQYLIFWSHEWYRTISVSISQCKIKQVVMHASLLFLYNVSSACIVEPKPDMKVYDRVRL